MSAHPTEMVLLSPEEREGIEKNLQYVESYLREVGLPNSEEYVNDWRGELLAYKALPLVTASDVVSKIAEVHKSIRREMSRSVFLYVPREDAEKYTSPTKGWEEVISRFSKARINIEESSFCFALGRYGASVFHILLVAELGVIEIATLIGVAGDKPGWNSLKRIDDVLDIPPDKRTPAQQKYSSLLSSVAPLLRSMKESWRHKISHVENQLEWLDADFSPRVAEEISVAVRGFMIRLAKDIPAA
jgi:hypothetical protein